MRRLERRLRIHGVDLYAQAGPMPGPGDTSVVFTDPPEWDSDGFFNSASPTRVVIPNRFDGRYVVRMTIHWNRAGLPFTTGDRENGFFSGELATDAHPDGRFQEARVAVAPVANSTRTVMHMLWEGSLARNNYIEPRFQYELPSPAHLVAWFHMRRLGISA